MFLHFNGAFETVVGKLLLNKLVAYGAYVISSILQTWPSVNFICFQTSNSDSEEEEI